MKHAVKRLAMAFLLVSVVAGAAGLGVSTVAATDNTTDYCSDPEKLDQCDETQGMDNYRSMLSNLFEIAHTTLQYAGFVTVFAGATLWFTARRSSDRAQTGVWLLVGGLAMIVFYFGFTTFVSLLKWIAEGGQ